MESVFDALFSRTQQRVLVTLFATDPGEGLSYAELLRRTDGGAGAIHRELQRFVAAGLVLEKRVAGRRLYFANPASAVYSELSSLAEKLLSHPPRWQPAKNAQAALDPSTLRRLSKKYLWWHSPANASPELKRLVAQVMKLGDYEDVQLIVKSLGKDFLCDVLTNAEAGQFDARSWAYWNYRLGLTKPGKAPPPMPVRAAGP